MPDHPYRSTRGIVALAVLAVLVVAIAVGVALGASSIVASRVIAGAVALLVAVGAALAIRALLRQAIVVEPGRIGRRSGWRPASVAWCELADVRHVTVAEYRTLFGGPQRNLILWTVRGGASGPLAAIATAGIPSQERAVVSAARATHPDLRPFVAPLVGMPAAEVEQVLSAVGQRG